MENRTELPPCGCGGENKPRYELRHLLAMLEREEQKRKDRERRLEQQERN